MINIFKQNINHIKTIFNAQCDVYEYSNFKDEDTKITSSKLILKYKNILCRVSYYKNRSTISYLKSDLHNDKIKQDIKLILQNDIDIKPGSLIIIRQNDKETKYKNSGKPFIYSSHQEIMLKIFEETT